MQAKKCPVAAVSGIQNIHQNLELKINKSKGSTVAHSDTFQSSRMLPKLARKEAVTICARQGI